MESTPDPVRVDAKRFQTALGQLCQTMVQKMSREGTANMGWFPTIAEDIVIMLRYSLSIYSLLFYLNADIRREKDTDWHEHYGVTAMSLVRSLIDCLYNITLILQNPGLHGPAYRKSGLRKMLNDIEEDHQAYLTDPRWEEWYQERRKATEMLIRKSGFTVDEVEKQPYWQTLGSYLVSKQPGGVLSKHQEFLKQFTFLGWRQYSALSHGAFEAFMGTLGHHPVGAYYMRDFLPQETRPKVDEGYHMFLSSHIGRAATVLLCIITEIQAYCKFEGHRINERICEVWDALKPLFETEELYRGRYEKLLEDRGIRDRYNV